MHGLVRRHRMVAVVASVVAGGLAGVLALNGYVLLRGSGATRDVAQVHDAQVAIVPGALVHSDGRMSRIFGVRDAVPVTQDFHMARALYLARSAGLQAQGLVTGSDNCGKGAQSTARELLARVKSAGQGTLHPAVLGGPPHPIAGDGRGSWGPNDPLAPAP